MKSQEEQQIHAQVEEIRGRLQDLDHDLGVVDGEVESLGPQREHHELLERACDSLEQLGELGAAPLFWGEQIPPSQVEERLSAVRRTVGDFNSQLVELDQRRQAILDGIAAEKENLEILGEDLDEILQAEERRKNEWIVERDITPLPRRVQRMAWARGGEEDRRFHKTLASAMMTGLLFGAVLPLVNLPLPEPFVPDEMPRRLAQLVRQEQIKRATPPPPETYAEDRPQDKEKPENEPEPPEEPDPQTPAEAEPQVPLDGPMDAEPGPPGPAGEPRQAVQKAGILAFRDKFASLAKDQVDPRLGADARLGNTDDVSSSAMPTRSMLTTNAPGSSGGINIGSLSRNVGGGGGSGGGGGGIQGVPVGRATSTIASIGGGGGGGRPLARGGVGLSRTDEEIQIVFDRYKASFYRLYHRELRKDTTLRGQMVLRLTIEPDGSVSMCQLQSSDMNAPTLADQVVARVRTINFGAKEGVKPVTIVYPIDFLPAA